MLDYARGYINANYFTMYMLKQTINMINPPDMLLCKLWDLYVSCYSRTYLSASIVNYDAFPYHVIDIFNIQYMNGLHDGINAIYPTVEGLVGPQHLVEIRQVMSNVLLELLWLLERYCRIITRNDRLFEN